MRRPRILFVTSTPPADEMGGSMLLYRQFVQRDDYDLFVITDNPEFQSSHFPFVKYEHPPLIRRLQRTRLSLFAHDYIHMVASRRIPKGVFDAAEAFRPDVIMMGAETWIADLAIRLASRINVPLVGHFMDWPTFGILGHDFAKKHCSKQFKKRYQACDLAFGICPEMLDALGAHPNRKVFYPPGNQLQSNDRGTTQSKPNGRFKVLFAGNLGQWYGKMLLSLAKAMEGQPDVCLRIAGKNHEWSDEEAKDLEDQGVFRGFLKGEAYQKELDEADALLVIMGFSEASKLIESTSFKSKMADYLVSGKPTIVWGPAYCTAATTARRHRFAEVVDSESPAEVLSKIRLLSSSPELCTQQVANGRRFYNDNLAPDRVFSDALHAIQELIDSAPSNLVRKN